MSEQTSLMRVQIRVRSTIGTYQTNTISGVKASASAGATQAAELFGRKYWGPSFLHVEIASEVMNNAQYFDVFADEKYYAWVQRSGRIQVGPTSPPDHEDGSGVIVVASGPRRALSAVIREEAGVSSRNELVVPGVGEVVDCSRALDLLIAWTKDCAKRNRKSNAYGVLFKTRGVTL